MKKLLTGAEIMTAPADIEQFNRKEWLMMNTQDNLLKDEADMCSFCEDDMENMCSNKEYDTCWDGSIDVKGKRIRVIRSL